MAFDFPAPAVVDQVFLDAATGVSYRFNGVAWMRGTAPSITPLPPGTGLAVVTHDASLTGDGTVAAPLAVNIVDVGAF